MNSLTAIRPAAG